MLLVTAEARNAELLQPSSATTTLHTLVLLHVSTVGVPLKTPTMSW